MITSDERFDDAPWDAAPGSDPSDWELAAAACELAMLAAGDGEVAPLPATVRGRIAGEAAAYLPRRGGGVVVPAAAGGAAGRSPLVMSGWWVAACLAVAVAWLGATGRRDAGPRAITVAKSPAELRRQLLVEDPDAVTVAWKAGKDPAIAAAEGDLGDVVWSPERQQGFMRIRGLAVNDPTVEQYQLWIFDAERNAAHPVDGGVFDVTAVSDDGDVVVPMDPRLPVGKATLFAVTVEKPGGVVVSSRERLPLLAAVQ
jgi:hypothetical protein